jgi:2-polyprenyl-3-methyl-5-hydroxy-6-metoxy-1,4-benzoquinol methylase
MAHSDDYKAQLQRVHEQRTPQKAWGTTGGRNAGAELVSIIRGRGDIKTVLDFGCGQRTLEKYVQASSDCHQVEWHNYDPGLPGLDTLPTQDFDLIVSTDVLEHVEPDMIDETLDWMRAHAKRGMYHQIACDPCGLILPDGRNAHLITERLEWWLPKFDVPGWGVMQTADCVVRKRGHMKRHCMIQVDNEQPR